MRSVARVGGECRHAGHARPTTGRRGSQEAARADDGLETAGWDGAATAGAKDSLNECVAQLKSAGVDVRTHHNG